MKFLKVENCLKKFKPFLFRYLSLARERWVSIFSFSIALAFHIFIVSLGTKQYLGSQFHPERSNQTVQKLEEAIKKKNMRFVYIKDDPSIISDGKPNPEAPLSDKNRVGSSPDGGKGKSWDPYSEGNSPIRQLPMPSIPPNTSMNVHALKKEIQKSESSRSRLSERIIEEAKRERVEKELKSGSKNSNKEIFATEAKEVGEIEQSVAKGSDRELKENSGKGISNQIGQMMVESLKGGFRNTNASRLNKGTVSFETSGWDLGPYARIVQQKVESNWRIPAVQEILRQKGWTAVHFEIRKDGTIENIKIEKSSGIPSYDQAAVNALISSSSLPPLPSFVTEEKISGTFRFFYNMWSEDDE